MSDNGPLFSGIEFGKLVKTFTLETIKFRSHHPESNGLIERYHRSFRKEGIGEWTASDYYHAFDQIENWVNFYNNHRLHGVINYLRPIDYYRGNPEKLVKERMEKIRKS